MNKVVFAAACAAGCVFAGSAGVPLDGGVFKDAVYWFTGAVDRNGDGYLSQTPGDEIRNTLRAADTAHAQNAAYAAAGPLDAHRIERTTVTCPYAGLTLANASVLRVHPLDSYPFKYLRVFLANASETLNQNTSYTVLLRARRESGSPYYSVFASVGGIRFGVMGGEGPWIGFPSTDKYIGGWTKGEEWFDVAYVMDAAAKKATVHAIYEGSAFRVQDIAYPQTYLDWTGGSPAVNLFVANTNTGPNAAVHQFAVWERALSAAEVKEAFSWPAPAEKMQIGYRNGSADEFASLSDLTHVSAADPLSAFPHALDADRPEITTTFEMDAVPIDLAETKEGLGARYAARAQAVICRFAEDSGTGVIECLSGGVSLGCGLARPGRFTGFVVPAALVSDTTPLTLRWKSGGAIKLDTVFVPKDADWQIGYRNNSCFDDGFAAGYMRDYRVGDSWGKFTRCLTGSGNGNWTNLVLTCSLPEEAVRFRYKVEVRWVHMVSGQNPKNGIRVNGALKALDTVTGVWTTTTAVVTPKDLKAGENTIELFRGTDIGSIAGDYDQIDYVRFEPIGYMPESGLSVIVQ